MARARPENWPEEEPQAPNLPPPPRVEDFFGPDAGPRQPAGTRAPGQPDPYNQAMLRVAGMVGELSASIVGSVLVGWFIDRWAGTSPRWTMILGILGIVGGGLNFVRRAMALNRSDGKSAGGGRGGKQ